MAITIEDRPAINVMNKATRPLILTLSSDQSNQQAFRFLLEVFVDDTTVVQLESAPNQAGVGHFDLYRITETYLEEQQFGQTFAGVTIHFASDIEKGPTQARKFSCVYGEKYLDVNGDLQIVTYPGEEFWWYEHNGNFFIFNDSYSDPFKPFELRDGNFRPLTSVQEFDTYDGSWGVIGCQNFVYSPEWTRADIIGAYYEMYDANGGMLGGWLEPITQITPDLNLGNVYDNLVLYAPLQWENVRGSADAAGQLAIFDAAAYYEMYFTNSGIVGVNLTDKVRVNKREACEGYDVQQVTYVNRFGAWESFHFTQRNKVTLNYDRRDFTKLSDYWNQEKFQTDNVGFGGTGGGRSYAIAEVPSFEMNTDWLTETQATQIYHLLQSPYCLVFAEKTNGGFSGTNYIYNAKITQRRQEVKTTRWDRQIRFTINIEVTSSDFR